MAEWKLNSKEGRIFTNCNESRLGYKNDKKWVKIKVKEKKMKERKKYKKRLKWVRGKYSTINSSHIRVGFYKFSDPFFIYHITNKKKPRPRQLPVAILQISCKFHLIGLKKKRPFLFITVSNSFSLSYPIYKCVIYVRYMPSCT